MECFLFLSGIVVGLWLAYVIIVILERRNRVDANRRKGKVVREDKYC